MKDVPRYKLDANESSFETPSNIINNIIEEIRKLELNRYPDTKSTELRRTIASYLGVNISNIIVGNGSDEMIKLIINGFVQMGDVVLSHSPTFSMYSITSKISGAEYIAVDTDKDFNLDISKLISTANNKNARIIFICNPNNPTGNIISKEEILRIIQETKAIVVVDEAYIEFGGTTIVDKVRDYDRLIVLRTLSKAFGMAGIRMGYLVANNNIINTINGVKPPYNLNSLTQVIARDVINNQKEILDKVQLIKKYRDNMLEDLRDIPGIKAYPSHGNFILIRIDDTKRVYDRLLTKGFLVRLFSQIVLNNHIRITVGSKEENEGFIKALKEVMLNEKG